MSDINKTTDNGRRAGGIGRLLTDESFEGKKKTDVDHFPAAHTKKLIDDGNIHLSQQHNSFERSVSYGSNVLSPNKRGHLLCRLAAFDIPTVPKQASSPLPHETHRIYDHHHLNSRSWNDDYQPEELEKPAYGGVQVTAVVRGTSSILFSRSDHSSSSTSPQRITALSPASPYQPSPLSTYSTDTFKAEPSRPDKLARECQDLWKTRRSLAHDFERPRTTSLLMMNNTSTDIASDDPSTSFESNTIAVDASFNEAKHQNISAEVRRQKYRSLLLNRRASSRRKRRGNSINLHLRDDILNELTERSSSFRDSDSSMSLRPRRLSNKHKENRIVRATSLALKNINKQRRTLEHATRSYDMAGRDYSVDRTSDSIFKNFIRVDPQFEEYRPRTPTLPSRLRPVDHEYQSRPFSHSIDYYSSFR
ncbi:unnamed protein product [Bursaphelenchus xylophilus]|uniref:(pine wood nematode) hypothetical protein n=1 Tax=Bursaphelenchus xylophilus TaxID=6326 RepID=A0A1I7SW99_BURXY|nr:unnamed protein product [Bursaphelenchus xylophilus]CAG9099067.1 unnamed protein product [Bursaphelenchus xylophilus]